MQVSGGKQRKQPVWSLVGGCLGAEGASGLEWSHWAEGPQRMRSEKSLRLDHGDPHKDTDSHCEWNEVFAGFWKTGIIWLRYYMNNFHDCKKQLESYRCNPGCWWDVEGLPQRGGGGGSDKWQWALDVFWRYSQQHFLTQWLSCVWERERNHDGSSLLSLSNWRPDVPSPETWKIAEGARSKEGAPVWTSWVWEAQVEMLIKLWDHWICALEQTPARNAHLSVVRMPMSFNAKKLNKGVSVNRERT